MASGSSKNASTQSFQAEKTNNLSNSLYKSDAIDIFLNHANSYHGKSIVQVRFYLSKSPLSPLTFASFQEILKASQKNEYAIYGTLENLSEIDVEVKGNIRFVDLLLPFLISQPLNESLIKVLDKNDLNFIDQVVACDFILYDINNSSLQIDEARKVLKKLEENFERIKNAVDSEKVQKKKSFILISTILTWFMTT
jgi:hypothetical protein